MAADFEDMSCEMVYGQVPPSFEEDPVAKQPCFADICKLLHFMHLVIHGLPIYQPVVSNNITLIETNRLHGKSKLLCLPQAPSVRTN